MDGEYEQYIQDKRIPCKYGAKCYQKNPAHHEKYKHPSNKNVRNLQPSRKKFKAENKAIVTKNASDSDDSEHGSNSENSNDSSNSEDSKKAPNSGDSKIHSELNDNSESTFSTKNENQKVNIDVSSSDDETVQTDFNHVEENNGKASVASELGTKDESNEFLHKARSSDTGKKTDKIQEKENKSADFIEQKFLVTMPEDFYQFWDFCKKMKPSNPLGSLKEVGLYLIGPFDVLAGKFSSVDKSLAEYLIHWRYYRDPPELQTVLKSDDPSGYHIGYFRDSPDELPVFLASNSPKKNGILTQMGGNIFSAVNIFLEELKKSGNPFKKMAIGKIQSALTNEADRLNIDMSRKTQRMVVRDKKIVTRTFNKIGLVVPYDKKTEQGYRELALGNKELEKVLTKLQNAKTKEDKESYLSTLQPVFTYASIAADECDFGTGIELGWNIISHGIDSLNATAERFLVSNYKLLNREAFAKIAEAHMKNRKQSLNLSIL